MLTRNCRSWSKPNFPVDPARSGIFGHSMGGAWRADPRAERSEPIQVGVGFRPDLLADTLPLGEKALTGYLGTDRTLWRDYDATALIDREPRMEGACASGRTGHERSVSGEPAQARSVKKLAGEPVCPWIFACKRVTTTATFSSRASSKNTFDSTQAFFKRRAFALCTQHPGGLPTEQLHQLSSARIGSASNRHQ